MSFDNLNNNSPNDVDIFLKCLSKFYQSEFESDGDNLAYRKLKLRDSVVEAYNKKFKTKLKAFQLVAELKQKEKSYQPYEWQKMFLDVFTEENQEPPIHKNQVKSNLRSIENMTIAQESKENITKEQEGVSAKSSSSAVTSVECKPDILLAAQDIDYKTMSDYELKRAFLISKLEMLDAQEALRKAKENIRLNEEEYLKRKVDEP